MALQHEALAQAVSAEPVVEYLFALPLRQVAQAAVEAMQLQAGPE